MDVGKLSFESSVTGVPEKFAKEGLTFDDVLLVPAESSVLPNDVSTVGSGDVLLAAFIAARHAGRPHEESLRAAVAAGAASTLEIGAGQFDPRQAGRLQAGVTITELQPVEA